MKSMFFKALAASGALATLATPVAANDEAVSVVQRQLDAYRAKDMGAFIATFTDDAMVDYQGMTFRGKSQIRRAFSLNFAPGAPSVYLVDSGISGDQIWMQAGYTFQDGSDMCCSVSRYTVRGGRIVQLEVSGPN